MASKLEQAAKDRGIKYFLVSFADLKGSMRAKLVPAAAIAGMEEDGAGFAGFATWLDMSPADGDILAMPDPDSLIQLPWQPEVGWVAGDLWMNGEPVEQAPRNVLKRVIEAGGKRKAYMRSGVELEFSLITPDGSALADTADCATKPCYDPQALMRRFDLIREMCDAMQELGWEPYQNDHEDANGQFEMNWGYADVLITADRTMFFKYMAKTLAEKYGLRATFMPKPFIDLTGNGCHAHMSLWDQREGGNNLFMGDGELGLSQTAYHFLGGLLHSAPALCALTNPTVNSYKRINAPVTASGATWAPNAVTYTGNNRTHMVRIPDSNRLELRLPDCAANPYLMQAGMLASGLDGLENKRDPGERLDVNMYTDGHLYNNVPKLPLNLLDALRGLETNEVFRKHMGNDVIDGFIKLKMAEWNDYARHLTEWERRTTLDC